MNDGLSPATGTMDRVVKMSNTNVQRCSWCGDDPLYVEYHDTEWGIPVYDDQRLFEMLCLEGQQAGLSWITILRKRAHYQKVFAQFNPNKLAKYTDEQLEKLLSDPGIVRNRLKVFGIRKNALAYLALSKHGSFSDFVWQFVEHTPRVNSPKSMASVPGATAASDAMSKALKKAGFTFVGSTICYAFMQACGMVNDHVQECFVKDGPHVAVKKAKPAKKVGAKK